MLGGSYTAATFWKRSFALGSGFEHTIRKPLEGTRVHIRTTYTEVCHEGCRKLLRSVPQMHSKLAPMIANV